VIVVLAVAVLIAILVGIAQILGLFFGAVLAFMKPRSQKYAEPPSHVRLLESHKVTEEDLEGWDGEDELEI